MRVQVIESGFQEPLATTITVVQALPKGDRSKEAIELLTEAGVDRIVPWAASRSIGKGTDKFAITAREASKQTRRNRIPFVMGVLDAAKIAAEIPNYDLVIVLHEGAQRKFTEVIKSGSQKVLVIIGPEGGLTDEEVALFSKAGAQVALLGRPIFRSAHAGMAALSGLNAALRIW